MQSVIQNFFRPHSSQPANQPIPVIPVQVIDNDWRKDQRYYGMQRDVDRKYGNRCAITGIHRDAQGITLHRHHLYSGSKYTEYRYDADEVILILSVIHDDFHSAMGGSGVPVTRQMWEDWIKVNAWRYTSTYKQQLTYADHLKIFQLKSNHFFIETRQYGGKLLFSTKVALMTSIVTIMILRLLFG